MQIILFDLKNIVGLSRDMLAQIRVMQQRVRFWHESCFSSDIWSVLKNGLTCTTEHIVKIQKVNRIIINNMRYIINKPIYWLIQFGFNFRFYKVVSARYYLENFASDRSHMIDKNTGEYLQAPPNYPKIETKSMSIHFYFYVSHRSFLM